MSDAAVLQVLNQHEIIPAGALIRGDVNTEQYFVFVEVSRDSNNRQIPSNRRLHDARNQLAQQGVSIEFLLKDAIANDIEAGLRATILHAFIDNVRNVFLSILDNHAHIWIEPKTQFDDEVLAKIRERAVHFLDGLDLPLGSISSTVNQNLPSKLAMLSVLRQRAPATLNELLHALAALGFVIPSVEWLNRRLDALRHEEAIVRTESGLYILSLKSLTNLGTKKNAASPDISRLLAMAKLDG